MRGACPGRAPNRRAQAEAVGCRRSHSGRPRAQRLRMVLELTAPILSANTEAIMSKSVQGGRAARIQMPGVFCLQRRWAVRAAQPQRGSPARRDCERKQRAAALASGLADTGDTKQRQEEKRAASLAPGAGLYGGTQALGRVKRNSERELSPHDPSPRQTVRQSLQRCTRYQRNQTQRAIAVHKQMPPASAIASSSVMLPVRQISCLRNHMRRQLTQAAVDAI
jgi:hypothetical protein